MHFPSCAAYAVLLFAGALQAQACMRASLQIATVFGHPGLAQYSWHHCTALLLHLHALRTVLMQVVALEPHTEVLRCHNWLGTAQRFQVSIAMQPPTAAARLTGVRSIANVVPNAGLTGWCYVSEIVKAFCSNKNECEFRQGR